MYTARRNAANLKLKIANYESRMILLKKHNVVGLQYRFSSIVLLKNLGLSAQELNSCQD
jgi:hypothetical protein